MRTLPCLLMLLALGACSTSSGGNTYTAEYDRLVADCRERGGILAPTGSQSGRPQNDNICRVTGLPSGRLGSQSESVAPGDALSAGTGRRD